LIFQSIKINGYFIFQEFVKMRYFIVKYLQI